MATYLVTGANRGLGLEFSKQLIARSDHVLACCRSPDEAKELQGLAGDHLSVHPLDVSSANSVAKLRNRLAEQSIDVLINNAGVWGGASQNIEKLDYEAWSRTLATNLYGPVRMLQALRPNLARSDRKLAVTITSGMGSIGDNTSGGYYAYRTSKAAVNMAMRSAAADLRDEGIIVTVMNPGWVQTDMGGSNASISPAQSISKMLEVIDSLTIADSGSFRNYTGEPFAW